jgi:hypothetical protein
MMHMTPLEEEFVKALYAASVECRSFGYIPSRFEQDMHSGNPAQLSKKYVVSSEIHSGLKILKKHGRLDLSLEAIMQQPRFAALFSAQELAAAQWRLTQV